jgi:hypothetical protein
VNDGCIKLDILRHTIPKLIMRKNLKYTLVPFGGIIAMVFFASCQQQGSTTTTPAGSSTVARSRSQTVSATRNRDIPPGGSRRAPTPSPTP